MDSAATADHFQGQMGLFDASNMWPVTRLGAGVGFPVGLQTLSAHQHKSPLLLLLWCLYSLVWACA
eukprot:6154845-Ditylum_brightwellii.AAC.1